MTDEEILDCLWLLERYSAFLCVASMALSRIRGEAIRRRLIEVAS